MKSERRKFRMVLAFAVLFAMLAFINIGCADGTPPEEEWNKTFGGTEYDTANSVQQASDGGYILAGSTKSYGDDYNMLLVKTDPNGTKQWDRIMIGPKSGKMIECVQQTSDGGYILAGGISFGGRPWDFLVVKTNSKGGFQWEQNIGQAKYDDFANSVQQTSDGGYILAGKSNAHGDTASDYDFRLLKTNFGGYPAWDRYIDAGNVEVAKSVQQTSDGGYILVGETYGGGSGDAWLVKTYSNGKVDWSKTFGGTDYDEADSVQQTSDGGYILAGDTRSYGAGGRDFWLVKTDSTGNEQWNKTFGGTGWDWANSVQQTSDCGYILTGCTRSYGAGSIDAWLVKTNSNGNEQWNKTFGDTKTDRACSVQQTTDGGYILTGETYSYGAGNADFWLIKVKGEPMELKVTSCDAHGDEKNDFSPNEGIWVKGNGFSPNTVYKIWIQDDPVNESDMLNISEDPSGLQETITTDEIGCFNSILIWNISPDKPVIYYEYDIVVDKQSDMNTCKFNSSCDGIDSTNTVGFVVSVPETFEKELVLGWNLISLPLMPENNSISEVLENDTIEYDAVFIYNATSKQFELITTDSMDMGIGYFVNITTAGIWKYTGMPVTSKDILLKPGLNMICWLNYSKNINDALSSIDGKYRYIARWNATSQSFDVYNPNAPDMFNNFETINRGVGYFISMIQGETLLITVSDESNK